MHFIKLTLGKGKERSLFNRHPWVFSGAIAKKEKEPEPGTEEYFKKKEQELLKQWVNNSRINKPPVLLGGDPGLGITQIPFSLGSKGSVQECSPR